jgi:rare lipoprotein A
VQLWLFTYSAVKLARPGNSNSAKLMSIQLRQKSIFAVLMTVLLLVGCASTETAKHHLVSPDPCVNPTFYEVNGKRYYIMPSRQCYRERGLAYWYEAKETASGELYDRYAMTAAHRTLPLPTYVEVTNLRNKRSVILKVNDRGPFSDDRLIDLSYAAAASLDMLGHGTTPVEVRAIDNCNGIKNSDTYNRLEAGDQDVGTQSTVPLAAKQETMETHALKLRKAEPAPIISRKPEAKPVSPLAKMPKSVESAAQSPQEVESLQSATTSTRPDTVQKLPITAEKKMTKVFVQVGSFLIHDNALQLQQRVEEQVTKEVRIIEQSSRKGTLYTVEVGPLDSFTEADRVNSELKALGINDTLSIVR